MTASCINLKKRFPEYRITLDPCAEDGRDPWYYQIPGKLGTIYPLGRDSLAVEVDRHPSARAKLWELTGETDDIFCSQDGDVESTFIFRDTLFLKVAAIVGSRKKRTVSPKTLARLKANLEKARAKLRASKSQ